MKVPVVGASCESGVTSLKSDTGLNSYFFSVEVERGSQGGSQGSGLEFKRGSQGSGLEFTQTSQLL